MLSRRREGSAGYPQAGVYGLRARAALRQLPGTTIGPPNLERGRRLEFDQQAWIGEMIHLDDRARRQVVLKNSIRAATMSLNWRMSVV